MFYLYAIQANAANQWRYIKNLHIKLFQWIFYTVGVFLEEENYKNNTKWIIVKTGVDDAEPKAVESNIFMESFQARLLRGMANRGLWHRLLSPNFNWTWSSDAHLTTIKFIPRGYPCVSGKKSDCVEMNKMMLYD